MNRARSKRLGLLVALIGGVAGLVIFELGLRIAGFSFKTFPSVQFGWPDPKTMQERFVADPDLLWVEQDYASLLADARRSPPDVIFMGDSCTELSDYPKLAMQRLRKRAPNLAKGMNVGVAGWTTQQGLWQLERDVLPLHPKVVTIYYGWNDHWAAFGPPDAETRPNRVYFALSQHVRLMQLFSMFRLGVHLRSQPLSNARVELPSYRSNLARMIRLVEDGGGVPVVITAASSHVRGQEPAYLGQRWLRDLSQLVPLHLSYVAATRQVARDGGAYLCDAFAMLEGDPKRASYFLQDGIHLSETGSNRLGDIVADCIARATQSGAAP
jgi:lysophospholipase L1-like esterase